MELTMSDQATTAPEGVDLAKAYLELTQALRDARAENAKLKAGKGNKLSWKVSEKGGVSVYGLGRFPLTLYAGQWPKLFAEKEAILAFIEENKAKLSFKD
jgi:hypothetical protein